MLNVEKWAQGKNPVIAYLAINHALVAREKSEALRHIKDRCVYGHTFSLPDLHAWFAMYTSKRPLLAYKRLISNISELTNEQIKLFSAYKHLDKIIKNDLNSLRDVIITRQEIEESLKYWQEMCAKTFEEIKEDIASIPLKSEIQDKLSNAHVKDELALGFYYLVYVPCQLFYETSPANIYRKALSRDVSAIQKLLKLDPLILHDAAIGFQIQSVRLYGKSNDYDDILAAIIKSPKINYKQLADERRSIKSDHGAQILALAKACKNPLDAPQIRDLFDKLAHDYDDSLIDTDIKNPAGFDKSIRTKAAAWQKQFQQPEKQK